jgi:hypothetical protein
VGAIITGLDFILPLPSSFSGIKNADNNTKIKKINYQLACSAARLKKRLH